MTIKALQDRLATIIASGVDANTELFMSGTMSDCEESFTPNFELVSTTRGTTVMIIEMTGDGGTTITSDDDGIYIYDEDDEGDED